MGTFAHKRFFAAGGAALRTIQAVLESAHDVRIATAYFAASGYQVLQEALRGKRVRLLIGRPEGGEDRLRDVLDEFMDELSMEPQEGRTRAMRQLLEALEQGWMAVSVGECPGEDAPWLKAGYLYQHAKLYIADRQAAVVTSANFTHHGLCQSLEAGYVVTETSLMRGLNGPVTDGPNGTESLHLACKSSVLWRWYETGKGKRFLTFHVSRFTFYVSLCASAVKPKGVHDDPSGPPPHQTVRRPGRGGRPLL
jgi:phosphatidylserine/phosphatidylglycerophosphate/cardiolipin synthase-like enzyme